MAIVIGVASVLRNSQTPPDVFIIVAMVGLTVSGLQQVRLSQPKLQFYCFYAGWMSLIVGIIKFAAIVVR
ncbi:MAG: hypothetical protein M3Q81_00410 [bacterium]|nr:hypothetical protein [bacterium]